ncbi:hypothetical protein ACLMJK_005303 [Lecanora helva]
MDDKKNVTPFDHVIESSGGSEISIEGGPKTSKSGVVLVPQPSNDPRDPLNWPQSKKLRILATLCLAGFAGIGAPFVHLVALEPEAKTFGRTPTQIAWSVSAAIAGEAVGPLFFAPMAHSCGRSSVIFWSIFGVLTFNIWGATMTKSTQFIPFLLSRLFAGLCGAIPSVFGARLIFDTFFVHERGRAFSVFHITFLLGVIGIPTLGAFSSADVDWPIMFWWTVAILGFTLIMIFLFLEETGFDRSGQGTYPAQTQWFFSNRIATFFPGTKVVPSTTLAETGRVTALPFIIAVTPAALIIGSFAMISFGFNVMLQVLQNVFIETPVKKHGYGFDLKENAYFSFTSWLALFAAQTYGHLLNDRVPMWICKRRGGIWKPEYRLHMLWLPAVCIPLGLGLFGACLLHHYSPVLLAFSSFLVGTGAFASVPITVTYCIECFTHYPAEAGIIMNFFRLSFGTTTSYFIDPWVEDIGVQWAFGMSAFFVLASFLLVILLMFKGETIRQIQFARIASSEAGTKLIKVGSSDTEKA